MTIYRSRIIILIVRGDKLFYLAVMGVCVMMPLTLFKTGDSGQIRRLHGNDEICRHLEDMGFVAGEIVTIVSETAGGYIVELKGSRLALNDVMASRIFLDGR